jgi:hypothetical protein
MTVSFSLFAVDFLCPEAEQDAANYIVKRGVDTAALLGDMRWEPACVTGVFRCEIYGHSILWDVSGNLHAGSHEGKYEILRKGAEDIDCYLTLPQVLAFLLAKHW